ncbi:MAG: ATP-binding cassette domain-containing protein [Alphaproteobacteria bacterium]|nr:ATP-binding cassette domain-containing protein [Alphaproteobacteria bacterium]
MTKRQPSQKKSSFSNKKIPLAQWIKANTVFFFHTLSSLAKRADKKAKPFIRSILKTINKVAKVLKSKISAMMVFVRRNSKNFKKWKKAAQLAVISFLMTWTPQLYQHLLRIRDDWHRQKKAVKRWLHQRIANKSSVFGKAYDIFKSMQDSPLFGNPFSRRKSVHKTPTFLQMEATECGSICFSIVLAHYGHELTAEEARCACGVSRDGSKASHIIMAARQYNMKAAGYSLKNLGDLDKCDLPAIIHWNFDHFVVYEGRIGKYFYINDPATGRRRVDFKEFNQNFTGVILILTPTKQFRKKQQESALGNFLSLSLKRGVSGILAAFFLSILQILPTLLIAFSSKVFIDYIMVKNMSYWLIPLTLILAGCVILQSTLLSFQQRLLVRLSLHFKLTLESLIIHKLFHLPLRFFDQRFSGDILYRLSSAEELSDLLSLEIMGALSNIFGMIIFTIVLMQLSLPLFLVMLVFIALRILVFYFSRESIRESNIHFQQQFGKVSGIAMNGLDMVDTLKANNLENIFFKNWAANHDVLLNKQQRVSLIDQRTSIMLMTLAGLMTVGLMFKGTYLVMGEQLTIGTLMAFMTLSAYLDGPLMTFLDFSSKIEKIKASINRFNDILLHDSLEEKDTLASKRKAKEKELPALKDNIILKDITFGYAPLDPPIFENLNLTIPYGKTVAFVGVSGSGKSTISKVICGLYPLTKGEILWDNVSIHEIKEELRTKRISLVDQDIYLFDGTVRDNLTSWDKDVDDEVLIDALQLVGLYNELLPRGLLNSPVGENGVNLSGGQRQRLEIARALIRKADVLILDEATSSLDVPNELHIFKSLSQLSITTIIIAHRLSTIQQSDMIHVIHEGKIVQSGSHNILAENEGIYKTLMKLETA